MIFSLLNVRKKTAATIAGIAIGALCLWGVAMWQDIRISQLANILLAILLLLGGVMLAALLLISCFKVTSHLLNIAVHNRSEPAEHEAEQRDQHQEKSATDSKNEV
ncbi:MAG: hypothetical protein PsegKO_26150 [Pseudohongiellaceae bacterium]|jgi:phosphatidylserine synthase